MIGAIQKSRIVNSYSHVLLSIILEQKDYQNILSELKNVFSDCEISKNITPIELKEYKKVISNLFKNVDKNDELQKFIYTILSRRYGFLMNDIINTTKSLLQDKLNLKIIKVVSRFGLNKEIKDNIENTIKIQIGNDVKIIYEIDKKMDDNEIEFISKDYVYKLNLLSFANDVLKI